MVEEVPCQCRVTLQWVRSAWPVLGHLRPRDWHPNAAGGDTWIISCLPPRSFFSPKFPFLFQHLQRSSLKEPCICKTVTIGYPIIHSSIRPPWLYPRPKNAGIIAGNDNSTQIRLNLARMGFTQGNSLPSLKRTIPPNETGKCRKRSRAISAKSILIIAVLLRSSSVLIRVCTFGFGLEIAAQPQICQPANKRQKTRMWLISSLLPRTRLPRMLLPAERRRSCSPGRSGIHQHRPPYNMPAVNRNGHGQLT